MKARKLKSGRYNVQVYIGTDANGKKRYKSVTADTKAEALRIASAYDTSVSDITVGMLIDRYLTLKKAVLSPTTYRSYKGIYETNIKNNPIASVKVHALNSTIVQRWISEVSITHTPKTVKNYYGLLTAAVKMHQPGKAFSVKLPQEKPKKLHTPTTAEVNTVLALAKETRPELYKAILLGAIGMMRRGEIAALTAEDCDFDKNTIRITKAQVKTEDNKHINKQPKTDASVRVIAMPQFVMDALPKEGPIVSINATQITNQFIDLMENADLPHFRFHDLRHYAASIAASSSVGASVESIKARGGWSTDAMMKRVYINQLEDEVHKDSEKILDYYKQNVH